MIAVEQPQSPSLLRRSTSIFRRRSKRDSTPVPDLSPSFTHTPAPRKLQRRSASDALNPHLISHIHHHHHHSLGAPPPHRHLQDAPPVRSPAPRITPRRRVLASDMRTTPFPATPSVRTVAWNVFLTPEQAYSLVMGARPVEMEDKWFVYAEGPDYSGKCKVHFHRSWTGFKMAELFILIDLKGEGAGKIVGIKWNGSEQTNGMEVDEVKYMVSTACAFVLGVNLEDGVL